LPHFEPVTGVVLTAPWHRQSRQLAYFKEDPGDLNQAIWLARGLQGPINVDEKLAAFHQPVCQAALSGCPGSGQGR